MKKTLRSLVLLLMLVAWVGNGFAADVTVDFSSGLPSDWNKTAGTVMKQNYQKVNAVQLQKNTTIESPSYTDKAFSNMNIKLTRSSNGTTFTVMYQIGSNAAVTLKSFGTTDVKPGSWAEYSIAIPEAAQSENVKFIFTSKTASYYINTITLTEKASNKTATALSFPNAEINIEEGNEASFAAQTATLTSNGSELTGKTITYKATGDAIFDTFNESTGAATLKTGSFGTAIITATFAGDDTYATSTASYTVYYTEKQKTATTLAFVDAPTTPKNIGDEFQLHTSLTATDAALLLQITFDSSDKNVATIDADGNVKALAKGTTTITATFAGDDTYAEAEASFRLIVIDPNAIEPVTFDFSDPESFGLTKPASNKDVKIDEGSSISSGIVTLTNKKKGSSTGSRFYNASGTIAYRAYNGDINTVSVPKGYVITKISISAQKNKNLFKIGENADASDWTGSAQSVDITYTGSAVLNSMAVTYEKLNVATLTLSETDANVETTIAENDGKVVNVKLQRTLKANVWNTICLPFAVSADDVKNVLKAEGNVREYEGEDVATATINFKDATALEAGVPYLIKPTEDATELNFEAVTIKNVEDVERMVGGKYCIMGIFAPYAINTNGTDLFLLASGKFAVPAVGKNKMNGFRAYFNVPSGTSAANVNINFGDATGISGVEADAVKNAKVYNLNGQYVGTSLDALPGGIYVVNGKKVMK